MKYEFAVIIAVFVFILSICWVGLSHADQVTGSIASYSQSSSVFNFVVEGVNLTTSDTVLFIPLVTLFNQSGVATFDYVAPAGSLNYYTCSDPVPVWPVEDMGKIYSFVVGALSCFCLILGLKMRF